MLYFSPLKTALIWATVALGVLFSLYLLALELFIIHAVCLWCSVSGAVILAIFVVAAAALPKASPAP